MGTAKLYYLTNRRHEGDDRWHPTGYGIEPSKDGTENLRFGRVTLTYDKTTVSNYLGKGCGFGNGDGEELAAYLCGQSKGPPSSKPSKKSWTRGRAISAKPRKDSVPGERSATFGGRWRMEATC